VTSGVPRSWGATATNSGVNLLASLSEAAALKIAAEIAHIRRPGDLVIVSLHWGPNWGYGVTNSQRNFAHTLIDQGDVSVIHGHSSHHPKGIEVYRSRRILYGCGDFLNDYEGIRG
jgi:poly-gamma-glutamate capsule biosynthesis protein CapA/YwtB (metallophosphatase superfamily)